MEQVVNKPSMRPPPMTGNSGYRSSTKDWDVQRPIIEHLYSTEDKNLKEVMEIMENEHEFHATYIQLLFSSLHNKTVIQLVNADT
jgi:hypothetical protein